MTLRQKVIEAMMTAEKDEGFLTDPTATEVALDAMLDCLTENADELVIPVEEEDGFIHLYGPLDVHAARLVRALREDR